MAVRPYLHASIYEIATVSNAHFVVPRSIIYTRLSQWNGAERHWKTLLNKCQSPFFKKAVFQNDERYQDLLVTDHNDSFTRNYIVQRVMGILKKPACFIFPLIIDNFVSSLFQQYYCITVKLQIIKGERQTQSQWMQRGDSWLKWTELRK